ncbi:MAG: universal stress protein [Cyanothece sp. SIO1E1]|nr:universal stress protein [Cyanothece sp. SIO1E1]
MFQRSLICTDFSDGLQRLVNFIPSLKASGMKQVVFCHNAPLLKEREIPCVDDEKVEWARDRLAVALQYASSEIDIKIEVPSGRQIDNILNLAKTYQTEIILLGMPNRSLLNERLFGSTTMGLSQRTTTPLLTLRPQLISAYTTEELDLRCRHLFRYLLIPYDGSNAANYLVEQIKQYAQRRDSRSLERCLLCWVIDEGGRKELQATENLTQTAQEKLAQVQAELEQLDIEVKTELKTGDPLTSILKAAEIYDITAIATSSESLGRLMEWSIPSFTGKILRRSWHPVIYFPPSRT